jgi:hypothetical protein
MTMPPINKNRTTGVTGDGDRVPLHKGHAIIHTATVDLKILRLDGKQMTLSTFRQLDEANILEGGDGPSTYFPTRLPGTPWGRVNYTW